MEMYKNLPADPEVKKDAAVRAYLGGISWLTCADFAEDLG